MTELRMRDAWTVLESPGLARLWAAARRKIEREGGVSGSVSLADLAPEERRAIAGLLGRPQGQGGRERVDLAQLDAVLRRSAVGQGLPEVLERFGGPLRDRGAEARRAEAERRAALALLCQCRHATAPWFVAWAEGLQASGRLARMQKVGSLAMLEAAVRVLDELPSPGVAIGVLAHRHTGDPKALDGGGLASLVLSALAAWSKQDLPQGQLGRRRLWERFGVVRDELSSQVLVLDLPLLPEDPLGRMQAALPGEPLRLTLRQLLRHPPRARPEPVFICENPVLVREAALRGLRRPLVCTEGQPSAACIRLLEALRASGCRLFAHADFDAAGLHIVRRLVESVGAEPWRMSAEDYREALRTGGHPRVGAGLSSPWDPELARAMAEEGRGVYEEALVEVLVGG